MANVFYTIARLTGLQGTPCEWTWEDLAAKCVIPPFMPKLVIIYNLPLVVVIHHCYRTILLTVVTLTQ